MNSVHKITAPRRRLLQRLLIGVGLCLMPFIILAVMAIGYFLPDREVTVLRNQAMAAIDGDWSTKVQFSVGGTTIDAVRIALSFVRNENIPEVRMALASIRKASVGIYERRGKPFDVPRKQFLADADLAMQQRGWMRLVGVIDQHDTVLVYVPQNPGDADLMDACVAVFTGTELVVASTKLKASALEELIKHQMPSDFKNRLKLASYRGGVVRS